ncbi:hypothetical protein [Microbacterium sp. MYb64]|uniref:hypothetical protein n=1 Tax=Microbacterium sp. MYb64 TaxID=1848691 RepID=UPI00215817DA|nr:hypothetical protein [Microbacterium sp. MYb64]
MSSGGDAQRDLFRTQSETAIPARPAPVAPESTEFGAVDAADSAAGPAPLDLSGLNRYDEAVGSPAPPFDPLRLCVFTTVALIACLLGPIAVLGFALIAIAGYARARRQGLLRSKCKLGDTRLVLAYLSLLAVLAAVATPFWVMFWIGRI